MDKEKYLEASGRTASNVLLNKIDPELIHAALGLQTETAEISDAIKRHLFYGESLDEVNLVEELGDVFFYAAMMLRNLGVSFEDAMEANIKKLAKRYPDKFCADKAINRDTESERKILEEECAPFTPKESCYFCDNYATCEKIKGTNNQESYIDCEDYNPPF